MDQKHIRMSIIGFAILLISLIGVSVAFFNYTRTGAINNLGTGRIYFNSTQSDTLNITNIFPMTATEASQAQLDSVTIGITGDTTYADGEEFEISIIDVNNIVNNKQIPIRYIATYTAATGGTIGTNDGDDYWEDREDKNSSIYILESTGTIVEGKQVLVGYIDNGATGISGTLTIKAYVDAERIAISDTYDGSVEDNMGTTIEWVNERIVLTTTEWNSLASTPISFKIRAESNEGIWVDNNSFPLTMEEMCPGCVYAYNTTGFWTTWNINNQTPSVLTSSDYYENYEDVVAASGKYFFLGLKLNESNQIEKAYACGLYHGTTPFCIWGYNGSGSEVIMNIENQKILQRGFLWDNTCHVSNSGENVDCNPSTRSIIYAATYSSGYSFVGIIDDANCSVQGNGNVLCHVESS